MILSKQGAQKALDLVEFMTIQGFENVSFSSGYDEITNEDYLSFDCHWGDQGLTMEFLTDSFESQSLNYFVHALMEFYGEVLRGEVE